MTERMIGEAAWGYHDFLLKSGVVAEKGHLACLDTTEAGKVVAGKASATLIPIGHFMESFTGDGVKRIQVKLFWELRLYWWKNDATAPLAAADIGTFAFILDSQTVTSDDTGHSVAGLVIAVDSARGVLIHPMLPSVPAA